MEKAFERAGSGLKPPCPLSQNETGVRLARFLHNANIVLKIYLNNAKVFKI
jgi:hypothetical protein